MSFPLDALRRLPDTGEPAHDAADRLLLDESEDARRGMSRADVAVLGDVYGALALSAAADATGPGVLRVHQDPLTGERALAGNAAAVGLDGAVEWMPLDAALVRGARIVLLRLPRALDALRDIAGLIAAHAASDVIVFAGGRIKHMSLAMNDVLREHFTTLEVSHARQKSRVLIARGPRNGRDPVPARAEQEGVTICAYGGVFAGASLDIGTRLLLAHLPDPVPAADDPFVDLACGTGIVGATVAMRHPRLHVYASDESAAAVASARATAAANGLTDRMTVARDDALSLRPDASASLIALNPPFHRGAALDDTIARHLFADAARALRPGGELWTVWNSHLQYRPALERIIGPTRQIARTPKFTLTASVKP